MSTDAEPVHGQTKRCEKCRDVKPVDAYRRTRTGLARRCLACQRAKSEPRPPGYWTSKDYQRDLYRRKAAAKGLVVVPRGKHQRILKPSKRCKRCETVRPIEEFPRYKECLGQICRACIKPREQRRPRAYYYTAEYKREQRKRAAEKAGREFVERGPGNCLCKRAPVYLTTRQFCGWLIREWLKAATPEQIGERNAILQADAVERNRASGRIATSKNPAGLRMAWRRAKHLRRLRRRDQSDGTISREGFDALYRTAQRCIYCGCRLTKRQPSGWRPTDATLDHLIPVSAGGIHGQVNVVIACVTCNFRKHDRDLPTWLGMIDVKRAAAVRRLYVRRYGAPPEQRLLV